MMQTLSGVRSDNFLKTFWISRHGRIRTRSLFSELKATYKEQNETNQLSIDLLATSEQYAALENADDPVWSQRSESVRKRIRSLRNVSSQQAHPVILSAMARFNDRELERILWLLEVVIVRYILIGSGNNGVFETTCSIIAKKIYNKEIVNAIAAFQEMRDLYPSDPEFETSFSNKSEENNQKAYYFLRQIEMEARRQAGGELGVELEPMSLTVEHILPKNPGSCWASTLPVSDNMDADEYTYNIGNMCLLGDVNRKLGNQSFEKKKLIYARSDLYTTRDVSLNDQWNPLTIMIRQSRMAKMAVSAWRFQ